MDTVIKLHNLNYLKFLKISFLDCKAKNLSYPKLLHFIIDNEICIYSYENKKIKSSIL